MTPSIRQNVERRIIKCAIQGALNKGYSVSHHDGEGYTLARSTDLNAIMKQIMATDEESLAFYLGNKRIGVVDLVYGNDGYDVIQDYTDNDQMAQALEAANTLADRLSR